MEDASQRLHHAEPVEDSLPGRDRLCLRTNRLLEVQLPLCQGLPWRLATPGLSRRRRELHRDPPPGRVRTLNHTVQLHQHRRQPTERTRNRGLHLRLEAEQELVPLQLRPDAADDGRGTSSRGHQLPTRIGSGDHRGGPVQSGLRRIALHRLDIDLPGALAGDRQGTARPEVLP